MNPETIAALTALVIAIMKALQMANKTLKQLAPKRDDNDQRSFRELIEELLKETRATLRYHDARISRLESHHNYGANGSVRGRHRSHGR